MNFNVEMLAFANGQIRQVEVPDNELTSDMQSNLELIFHYGQNDFQERPFPSVSVGDVVHYYDEKYIVSGIGFKLLCEAEYKNYLNLNRVDRQFCSILDHD